MTLRKLNIFELDTLTGGWGTGYANINSISCEKKDGLHITCRLSTPPPSKDEAVFVGTQIDFERLDKVVFDGGKAYGYMLDSETMMCALATGIIKCRPEIKYPDD